MTILLHRNNLGGIVLWIVIQHNSLMMKLHIVEKCKRSKFRIKLKTTYVYGVVMIWENQSYRLAIYVRRKVEKGLKRSTIGLKKIDYVLNVRIKLWEQKLFALYV